MRIYSVYDPEFREYGKVVEMLDTSDLVSRIGRIDYRGEGVSYEPGIESLEESSCYAQLRDRVYGGMPIQIGLCWGFNTRLNCLEYHRDSEINIGEDDFILLLAREADIIDGRLDTSLVKAFKVPGGVAVEVYATTLHYAPCQSRRDSGFKVAIVLPKGTNTERPLIEIKSYEDSLMTACNKWLLAHEESSEAKAGAVVALTGRNIDIVDLI